MPTLVLNQTEIRRLLPIKDCIGLMEQAFDALGRGDAVQPLRPILRTPDGSGVLGLMPAYLGRPRALGVKVLTVFPGNHGTPLDSHQGAVLLFDPTDGRLLAVMDASEITAIRTAAVSAVATKLLARADASDLAILGSGVQARTHLEAMALVRKLRRVRVYSRTPENAKGFARESSREGSPPVETVPSVEEAVRGADLICTATSAREPLLFLPMVRPGAHVNAVGSSTPNARELGTDLVAKARLFVDRRESTLAEAGDFLLARREGAIGDSHILAELADLRAGRAPGRSSPEEITLFKSLGLAIEDVAAAHHLYERARAAGAGTTLDLGGARHRPQR